MSADIESELGIRPDQLPRHIAIIMDGNGRWALGRGKERIEGHLRGAEVARATIEECVRLGIGQLTLYCLSSENWKRPKAELEFLFALLREYLIHERATIVEQNLRFRMIGRRDGLPVEVLAEVDENRRISEGHTGMILALAINYGSRMEMLDAVRSIAIRVRDGELGPEEIDEATFADSLYTAGMHDPDLMIRTAGEMRISNFLLWQLSYAELWVTPKGWPDFDAPLLHRAICDFANRERRFGGLKPV